MQESNLHLRICRRILNHLASWEALIAKDLPLQSVVKQQPPPGPNPSLCSHARVSEDASLQSPENTLFRDISSAAWLLVPVLSFTWTLPAGTGQSFLEPGLPFRVCIPQSLNFSLPQSSVYTSELLAVRRAERTSGMLRYKAIVFPSRELREVKWGKNVWVAKLEVSKLHTLS